MDASSLHKEYTELLSAFRRQLPDPGLRVAVSRDADDWARRCALAVWHAEGAPLTPGHAECWNAIYSDGTTPPSVLFWDLVRQSDAATHLPAPPFFEKMRQYDARTGRSVSRRFLQTLALLLLLFASVDGRVGPHEGAAIQSYLDVLRIQCDKDGLAGDRTPFSVAPYVAHDPADAPLWPADRDRAPQAAQADPAPPQEPEAPPERSLDELMAELDGLCGLDQVKREVHSLVNLVKVRRLREEAGLPVPPLSLHMVFQGNPGTGKTTVARLLGGLYKAIGVLPKGQLIEVDRSGLVAGFVGQTAIKTSQVIEKALGGILFIDEAYALTPDSPSDFGGEAIEVLLKGMEDHRRDLVVIVAGYTEPMERFLHANPGLESRFNKHLVFADYDAGQLMEIFQSMCRKNGYALTPEAEERARARFQRLYDERDENFGNAREVRNVFETAVARQADRVAALAAPTKDDLMALTEEDLGTEEKLDPPS